MPWTFMLIVIGAALPIVIAMTTVFFSTRGATGVAGLARAFVAGIALGTAGALVISAIVIGIVLGLRALR